VASGPFITLIRLRLMAITDHMASTTPNGQAPCMNPLTSTREDRVDPLNEGNLLPLSSLISPGLGAPRSDGELPPDELAERSSSNVIHGLSVGPRVKYKEFVRRPSRDPRAESDKPADALVLLLVQIFHDSIIFFVFK
jgi:hypothetical protein